MKNFYLLFFTFILVCETVFGQFTIENYPIDQFKLPDIDRQALEFSGNFFGNFNSKTKHEEKLTFSTAEINPFASLFYSRYINRPDLQATYAASFLPDLDINSTNNEFIGEKRKSSFFSPSLVYSLQRRNYSNQHFTLLGAYGQLGYDNDFRKVTTNSEVDKSKFHSFEFVINVPLGIGTGRIETVSDMAMALFLLKDAMDVGTDPALISPEQVNAFASKMVELRNERVFDSRAKRVNELRELYNFMLENHWTVPDDPGFFTVLTDNWLYNVNPVRFSGRRWTYSLTPMYLYRTSSGVVNGIPSGNVHTSRFGGEFRIDFEKDKPVNVHHDYFRTHGISLLYSKSVNASEFSKGTSSVFVSRLTTTVGQQWIPNSRTRVTAALSGAYNFISAIDISSPANHQITLSLLSTANYFISYRTQLFATFNIGYEYDKNGSFFAISNNPFAFERYNTGFNVGLNAGVTVSIF